MNQIKSFLRINARGQKASRGQSLVEFALLLPVFLMLVMGVLDIARAYSALQVVTNAAREGARVGILPGAAPADVTTAVNNYLTSGGRPDAIRQGPTGERERLQEQIQRLRSPVTS